MVFEMNTITLINCSINNYMILYSNRPLMKDKCVAEISKSKTGGPDRAEHNIKLSFVREIIVGIDFNS